MDTVNREPFVDILGPKITYHSEPTIIWQAGGKIDFDKGTDVEFYNGHHIDDVPDEPYDADLVPGCVLCIQNNR